ncbi:MAG: hypothetical protein ACYSW8_30820 [Planctomycetota bacterium]|jgi:hypothetical protein
MKVFVKSPDTGDPCRSEWDDIEGDKVEVGLNLRGGSRLDILEVDNQTVRLVLIGQPNINIQLEH